MDVTGSPLSPIVPDAISGDGESESTREPASSSTGPLLLAPVRDSSSEEAVSLPTHVLSLSQLPNTPSSAKKSVATQPQYPWVAKKQMAERARQQREAEKPVEPPASPPPAVEEQEPPIPDIPAAKHPQRRQQGSRTLPESPKAESPKAMRANSLGSPVPIGATPTAGSPLKVYRPAAEPLSQPSSRKNIFRNVEIAENLPQESDSRGLAHFLSVVFLGKSGKEVESLIDRAMSNRTSNWSKAGLVAKLAVVLPFAAVFTTLSRLASIVMGLYAWVGGIAAVVVVAIMDVISWFTTGKMTDISYWDAYKAIAGELPATLAQVFNLGGVKLSSWALETTPEEDEQNLEDLHAQNAVVAMASPIVLLCLASLV